MKKISCIALLFVLISLTVQSQTFDVVPYEYGFESSEQIEESHWVLNPGTDLTTDSIDRWSIGGAMRHNGGQGLYISNDGGVSCTAGSSQNETIVQFAYRDFVLPDGQYYFTFDWICPEMELYAGYVNYVNLSSSTQAQNITEQVGMSALPNIGRPSVGSLNNAEWDNAAFTITVKQPTDGTVRTTRVWFAWINTTANMIQSGISAAIDNIQLTEANCEIPSGFSGEVLDCDNVEFTWEGSSARYQLQYRLTGDTTTWRNRMVNNAATSISLSNMKEGNYDFRLRGICYSTDALGQADTTYSPFIYLTNFNIFCPELHCINYINLDDTVNVSCTYGKSGTGYNESVQSPYQFKGRVDYGWDNINSRHTIVWDTLATDPRTNGNLRMVPAGATASVRLGNWDMGNGTEAITYKYNVDADNSILLVNYAIVLEEPSGHGEDGVPRFIIRVKTEDGKLVDQVCGVVDLNSETKGGTGWNQVRPAGGSENVVYKDWTTLGLNLDPYVGQTLLISVETFDCFWSGHYGYAYFTMDCQTARIKNTNCGKQQSMTVHAPSGFKYAWYADNELRPRSTSQTMEILATDPTNWTCVLTSTEHDDCNFSLQVNTTARYPQAEFKLEYDPQNCENRYVFTNTSYIWTNEDGERHEHRDEVPDEYDWSFGKEGDEDNTSEVNPGYVTFPEEGGTFYVRLRALLGSGEGMCQSDTVVKIEIPSLGDTHDTINATICEGSYYEFHGVRYFENSDVHFSGKTESGCYANDSLHLVVIPQSYTMLDTTTICYGDTAWVGSDYRTRDGVLKHTFTNILGCDSVVAQYVHVMPHMQPSIDVQEIDEQHESGTIWVTIFPEDSISYYTINGTRYEGSTTLTDLVGGTFMITFYNRIGCAIDDEVRLCAYEVFQRWDDVVSLKNKDQRGGGEFVAYQWYDRGEPIAGANRSYYYKHEGFDGTEVLYCLVTLPDGSQDESCIFVPTAYTKDMSVNVAPTGVAPFAPIEVTVPSDAQLTVFTPMGIPVQSNSLHQGVSTIQAPAAKGVYLLRISLPEKVVTERIVVE